MRGMDVPENLAVSDLLVGDRAISLTAGPPALHTGDQDCRSLHASRRLAVLIPLGAGVHFGTD
jgi:hypothetical protein